MKILHITITNTQEGEGSAARHLHDALLTKGHESTLFALHQDDLAVANSFPLQSSAEASAAFLQRKPYIRAFHAPYLLDVLQGSAFQNADVIHLHAEQEYLAYPLLPYLTAKPLLWTLYDSRAYTGGCVHTEHCRKWEAEECQGCPIDAKRKTGQLHHRLFQLKQAIYAETKFEIAATSQWQKQQLESSILKEQASQHIPVPIDTTVFFPGDKAWARRQLGIPNDKKILLFDCRNGLDESGTRFLQEALPEILRQEPQLLLICLGKIAPDIFKAYSLDVVSIETISQSKIFATYLRAADILVHPHVLDQTAETVRKAAACSLPCVAFPYEIMKEQISHEKTGYLAKALNNGKAFAEGVLWLLADQKRCRIIGEAASEQLWLQGQLEKVVEQYEKLYKKVLPNPLQSIPGGEAAYDAILKIAEDQAEDAWSKEHNWDMVWKTLEENLERFAPKNIYKGFYSDVYADHCLQYVDIIANKEAIWQYLRQYLAYRHLESRAGHLPTREKEFQAAFFRKVRNVLIEYFKNTSLQEFAQLKPMYHEVMFRFWRWTFLNSSSTINLSMDEVEVDRDLLDREEGRTGYPKLLIRSMYEPHPEHDLALSMPIFFQAKLPIGMKLLVLLWLTNIPLYNGTVENQQIVLKHIREFSAYAAKHFVKGVPEGFLLICLEHFTSILWRAAYIGGNILPTLTAFGDFVRAATVHKYGKYEIKKKRKHKPGMKLRIGYISMNFRTQAVSFYMANRIFHHDPKQFEVYTYIIKRFSDDVTEKIKASSDKYFEYEDIKDVEAMMKDIVASDLDILIYADIGMDPVTYQLGSIRLAPTQAVLVGHGVSTGLSEIDYYISGDFEPENAQQHYRENLVCLPNLGAAQLPPKTNPSKLTRAQIGVPDDAVVLMSCANGLKYHVDRDHLLIQILQQAPRAWIVLKPFQNPNLVDNHLSERILAKARAANVADRLIILPPLADPADLWGLLTLADIQLDTYPYGGWTTNMEAVYAGLPIVTQEGDMARSRWGAAMLRALGVEAGIAYTEEEYVKWAVALVNDDALRQKVKQQIKEVGEIVLFNGKAAQGDYEKVLLEIGNRK